MAVLHIGRCVFVIILAWTQEKIIRLSPWTVAPCKSTLAFTAARQSLYLGVETMKTVTDNAWWARQMAEPRTITVKRHSMERIIAQVITRKDRLAKLGLPGTKIITDILTELREQVPECFPQTYQGLD